jgi:hypothetical protein
MAPGALDALTKEMVIRGQREPMATASRPLRRRKSRNDRCDARRADGRGRYGERIESLASGYQVEIDDRFKTP